MKEMKKRFGILLAATLILACFINLPVEAADKEYTYTVRFFAGQRGSFGDEKTILTLSSSEATVELNSDGMLICEGLKLGDTVKFNLENVVLSNESKYYVKGIRESGKDNNTVGDLVFTVNGDMDYVVAYGLRGNMVAYTVSYVDADDNELAPPDTYYGNVGDKPVVAYLYIDGYQPQAYNLTKTLSQNEAENVFRFIYTSLADSEIEETVTTEVLPGTQESVVEVIQGEEGADGGDGIVGGDGLGDGTALDDQQVPLGTIDLDNQTEDGIYIEEPSVPLADMKFQLGPIEVDAKKLLVTLVIVAAVVVMAVASFWYWRPYRKKVKNDEKDVTRPV